MAKAPVTIASASGIAVTHREREDRAGDYRVSDIVREAMEKAAADAMAAGKNPREVKQAIEAARNKILGIDEA